MDAMDAVRISPQVPLISDLMITVEGVGYEHARFSNASSVEWKHAEPYKWHHRYSTSSITVGAHRIDVVTADAILQSAQWEPNVHQVMQQPRGGCSHVRKLISFLEVNAKLTINDAQSPHHISTWHWLSFPPHTQK